MRRILGNRTHLGERICTAIRQIAVRARDHRAHSKAVHHFVYERACKPQQQNMRVIYLLRALGVCETLNMRWALQVRVSSALVRKVQGVGWNLSNNKRTLTNTFLTPCSRGADRVREREGDFACSHSFVWLHLSKQAVRRLTFVVTPSSASSAASSSSKRKEIHLTPAERGWIQVKQSACCW